MKEYLTFDGVGTNSMSARSSKNDMGKSILHEYEENKHDNKKDIGDALLQGGTEGWRQLSVRKGIGERRTKIGQAGSC